jgi:hypothetical protein
MTAFRSCPGCRYERLAQSGDRYPLAGQAGHAARPDFPLAFPLDRDRDATLGCNGRSGSAQRMSWGPDFVGRRLGQASLRRHRRRASRPVDRKGPRRWQAFFDCAEALPSADLLPAHLLLEGIEIDLHAVEDGAPVARQRGHRDRLLDLLVGGAGTLGVLRVRPNAVSARDLRRDGE